MFYAIHKSYEGLNGSDDRYINADRVIISAKNTSSKMVVDDWRHALIGSYDSKENAIKDTESLYESLRPMSFHEKRDEWYDDDDIVYRIGDMDIMSEAVFAHYYDADIADEVKPDMTSDDIDVLAEYLIDAAVSNIEMRPGIHMVVKYITEARDAAVAASK